MDKNKLLISRLESQIGDWDSEVVNLMNKLEVASEMDKKNYDVQIKKLHDNIAKAEKQIEKLKRI
ncbi:hypothetical protein ACFLQQ_01505 [Actinomycetota bacterium]